MNVSEHRAPNISQGCKRPVDRVSADTGMWKPTAGMTRTPTSTYVRAMRPVINTATAASQAARPLQTRSSAGGELVGELDNAPLTCKDDSVRLPVLTPV